VRDHAGVVAQHVHATEHAERAHGERLHLRAIAHVGANGDGVAAASLDLADDVVHAALVDVGDDDAGAVTSEGQGHGPSDAAGASGHDRAPRSNVHVASPIVS
jgi:hypothetical protein